MTAKAGATGHGGRVEFGSGHTARGYAQVRTPNGGPRLSFNDIYDKGVDESGDNGENDFNDCRTPRLNGDRQAGEALSFRSVLAAVRKHHAYDAQSSFATKPDTRVIDDQSPFGWKRENLLSFGATLETMAGRLVHDLSLSRTINRSRYDLNALWSRGTTDSLKYRAQCRVDKPAASAAHVLNLLAERQKDNNRSRSAFRKREMSSVALEYRGEFQGGISLQAGLRYDDNEVFDNFTGYNLAAAWQVSGRVRLHGSIGRASVNPSSCELYADDGYARGNPSLWPEQNHGIDLAVEFTSADTRAQVDVTAFHDVLHDGITCLYGGAPDGSGRASYVNQPRKSRRKGVEISGRWEASDRLSFGVNHTYLRALNPDGSVEVRRPRHEPGLQASWQSADERLGITVDLRHVARNWDRRYFVSCAAAELPDYTVVNLFARYALSDRAALIGRVQNVVDKDYSDVWGYRAQDRAVWAGLSADF